MNTMQPILMTTLKQKDDFLYEIKYDGFRAVLTWSMTEISIKSRKNTDLTLLFPEITEACKMLTSVVEQFLPLQLDGELVVLNNHYQANFSLIQQRGRMRSKEKINVTAESRPASLLIFDVLNWQGINVKQERLQKRKQLIHELFGIIHHECLRCAPVFTTYETVKRLVNKYMAEGIVAKRKNSLYISGKNHYEWMKEKNWRTIYGFLTAYKPENGYFKVSIFHDEDVKTIGHCKHGLTRKEKEAIKQIFLTEGIKKEGVYTIPPAICAAVHTLGIVDGALREPSFASLQPQMEAKACTEEKMHTNLAMLPSSITISNENKLYWKSKRQSKIDLLTYMRKIYPYMFPYLSNRALTIIRCPDGVEETCFFQKHLPAYSPTFMQRPDENIVCDRLGASIWLANHGAIEYHIPFEQLNESKPDNIVFDLDPPSNTAFPMAVETALLFRELFEALELTTFIKTSGNKGLQIHLPLLRGMYTYQETANFTENMANIIVEAAPHLCTVERLKNKRQGKLYIDHVQHGKNKTIIAPYSPRKTEMATIATPLYWKELNSSLSPDQFTLQTVLNRVETQGCPWLFTYEEARMQSFKEAAPLFNK